MEKDVNGFESLENRRGQSMSTIDNHSNARWSYMFLILEDG